MLEHEIRGQLTKEDFEKKLADFTKRFGSPKRRRRLALKIGAFHKYDIQTRLRITNGIAEVVQKLGNRNANVREEILFRLDSDVENIFNAYKVLTNNIVDPALKLGLVLQFDNYLFDQDDFELKLAHQTGRSDKYVVELEAKKEDMDLEGLAKDLDIVSNMEDMTYEDWKKWDDELNLDINGMSEEELKQLIRSYLKNT